MSGKVWLVGAGPGDPRLITVRGMDLLRSADAVVYDRLVAASLLHCAPTCAERYDVGKARGQHRLDQDQITELLIRLARGGKRVVRLKGGDPFVFGRGGEEALALKAGGVDWEVVPGVSAAIAAPALAGIPVTHRNLSGSFAVTTGHAGLLQPGLSHAETLVVLMVLDQLDAIVRTLLEEGRPANTPAALVQAAATPVQRTIRATLETLVRAAAGVCLTAPVTLVVGPTVALSEQLDWFERRPLFGRRVLLARTRPQPSELAVLLADAGADVHELPSHPLGPRREQTDCERLVSALEPPGLDLVVLPASRAVDALAALLTRANATFGDARVVCMGPKTAERARRAGWQVHGVPDHSSRADLVNVAINVIGSGARYD